MLLNVIMPFVRDFLADFPDPRASLPAFLLIR